MNNILVQEITGQKQWDDFVTSQPFYTFLQSWAWGEFLKCEGSKVYRFGFFKDSNLIGAAMCVAVRAKRGSFLFCPHGPLIDWNNSNLVDAFFKAVKDTAKQERVWFIRVSPVIDMAKSPNHRLYFSKHGYKNAPIHMHAETSWIIDISKSENEILAQMRKTTRYLIRQGEKMGVKTEINTDQNAMEQFSEMHHSHAKNNTYTPFSRSYLKNEWQVLFQYNQIAILFSQHEKKILASAVIIFYGAWAFYYQAITQKSKIPAGYSLICEAIKEAKRRGCTGFNMWGIADNSSPKHPWAGLTLFKQGFGGNKLDLMHAQDLPLSPLYWTTYMFETIRRIKRGF